MIEEMAALHSIGMWDLVSFPIGKSRICCKWVYIIKVGLDGTVNRLKACLVLKGYTYVYDSDCYDTFSLVAKVSHVFSSLWQLHVLGFCIS